MWSSSEITQSLIPFNAFIYNWYERLEYTSARLDDYARLGKEIEHEKEKLLN